MAHKKNQLTTKTFTPEIQTPVARKRRLQQLILQINQSTFMQCLALQEIRDNQLYLEDDKETMQEFLNSETLAISSNNSRRMLEVIDALGNNDYTAELMQNHGLLALTEMIHDEKIAEVKPGEAKIVYIDGTEVDLQTQIKLIEDQIIKSQKKETNKIAKQLSTLKEQKSVTDKDTKKQIEQLKKAFDSACKERALDPKTVLFIENKTDAKKVITAAFGEITTQIGYLTRVPEELRDVELAMQIELILSALKGGVKGLHESWNGHLFAATQSELN